MILEKISFLLKKTNDSARDEALRAMLTVARTSMEEDGVTTEILILGEDHPVGDAPCERNVRGSISGQSESHPHSHPSAADGFHRTLYLSDFREGIAFLRAASLPCAGWRHSLNAGEDLSSASYILEDLPMIDMDDFEKVYERETGLPWTILTTDRLLVREFTDSADDLRALYRIYSDKDAARFLQPLLPDPEAERKTLRSYIQNVYGFYGFGSWAVILQDTGEVIGRAGFGLPDSDSGNSSGRFVPSFGYAIRADLRGQGLASEVCAPLLAYGFDVLQFDAVTAEADEENTPSLKLLRSLGFCETGRKGHFIQFIKNPLR